MCLRSVWPLACLRSSLLNRATHIFNSGAGLAAPLSNVTPGLVPGVRTLRCTGTTALAAGTETAGT